MSLSLSARPPFSRFQQSLSNNFLMPLLTLAVAISLTFVAIGSFNTTRISQGFKQGIKTDFQLQQLSGEIVHLNEVLTMSARMAAATGDLSWENRYIAYEPLLIAAIDRAIALAPDAYNLHADRINEANRQLIALDSEAFRLVHQQNPQSALAILFSPTYRTYKEAYASGMRQWSEDLNERVQANLNRYGSGLFWSGLFSLASFWVLMLAWAIVLFMVNQYIRRRKSAEKGLRQAKGQLEDSHQELQVSKAALQQKAVTLEQILLELKQAQVHMVQSEKMTSLGQLVAGVAHEINNPVNFIYANLEPVREYVADLLGLVANYQTHYPEPPLALAAEVAAADLDFVREDLPKILTSMEVGTERIRKIVLSLHNFSRSDEQGLKAVDIHPGIESTLMILQHRLKAQPDQPEIELQRDYGDLPVVECYPGQINQVFMNLLSNAIDALDEAYAQRGGGHRGQISIRTRAFTAADNTPWIEWAIADTGIGIPEEIQGRVFDAFFTTKPVGKGTGIGLTISYAIIVEKHGGQLAFSSVPGEKTEFTVRLPAEVSDKLASHSTDVSAHLLWPLS